MATAHLAEMSESGSARRNGGMAPDAGVLLMSWRASALTAIGKFEPCVSARVCVNDAPRREA